MSNHGEKLLLTPEDIGIAARTVWMEARGEKFQGQKAVAHVIIERTLYRPRDKWSTLAQTCLSWLQFSGWRENDPNFREAMNVDVNDPTFRQAIRAVLEAIDEPDFTKGARHYYARGIDPPRWAQGQRPAFTLGSHIFFNTVV